MSSTEKSKKVADYWNMRGNTYNRSWASIAKKRLSQMETNLVSDAIKEVQKSKDGPVKTLDIGVAVGRISEEILKHRVELNGTDISQTMVEICQEKFKGNNKVKGFKIHDIINPIPVDWGKFDVVTAIRVISYSPQWQKELRNIYDAMNPGGLLVFTFPNRYSSHLVSTKLRKVKLEGCTVSLSEIKKAVQDIGFKNIRITGYSRLLDSFYDWADNTFSSNTLFLVEKILEKIFGQTLFVRLFYVICQK